MSISMLRAVEQPQRYRRWRWFAIAATAFNFALIAALMLPYYQNSILMSISTHRHPLEAATSERNIGTCSSLASTKPTADNVAGNDLNLMRIRLYNDNSRCGSSQQVKQIKYETVVPRSQDSLLAQPAIAAQVLEIEKQGRGRNIIAMSLYGNHSRYTAGAIDNAAIARRDWHGWTLRMYHDQDGVPEDVLGILHALGTDLVLVNTTTRGENGMFWRFFALEDPTVTRVIMRDSDSRLTHR